MRHMLLLASALVALPITMAPASAEEGMWTFDSFPAAKMREQ